MNQFFKRAYFWRSLSRSVSRDCSPSEGTARFHTLHTVELRTERRLPLGAFLPALRPALLHGLLQAPSALGRDSAATPARSLSFLSSDKMFSISKVRSFRIADRSSLASQMFSTWSARPDDNVSEGPR